ncbi:MOB kinase activator 3C isoform X1 [Phoca vitulina]|uniref:MOB kinase activator 3C isoform X1 n=1 Tax=Phoca vitulina TaxID=9720 RepID=UPI001395E731|nr:MOB kinase activator 3C isoform X1 [Phoca vitulina]XP_032285602.1 MOB kinase activator 3C isoform X1 [Phoca vitulina]XP_032285613.1 MOB kinase activator 3C isoform X1 [Phoca vitulina]
MALCLKQVFAKDKTFRPRKRFEPGTQRFELYKKAQASLKSGLDLRSVVRLPPGENIDDWIAVHVVDFFNRINLIYGTMAERCSETSCPVMAGGPRYEYRWQDERRYRRPAKLSAPRYMALLMDWIEGLINDEDVFPTRVGVPFPKNFQQVCTKILTRLFRVFVHVYIHHFDSILSMGAEAHVNTCYKHFYYFIQGDDRADLSLSPSLELFLSGGPSEHRVAGEKTLRNLVAEEPKVPGTPPHTQSPWTCGSQESAHMPPDCLSVEKGRA